MLVYYYGCSKLNEVLKYSNYCTAKVQLCKKLLVCLLHSS